MKFKHRFSAPVSSQFSSTLFVQWDNLTWLLRHSWVTTYRIIRSFTNNSPTKCGFGWKSNIISLHLKTFTQIYPNFLKVQTAHDKGYVLCVHIQNGNNNDASWSRNGQWSCNFHSRDIMFDKMTLKLINTLSSNWCVWTMDGVKVARYSFSKNVTKN